MEKAKLALKEDDRAKANLFAYSALKKLSDKLDTTKAKAEARGIVQSYPAVKIAMNLDTKSPISSVSYSQMEKVSLQAHLIIL